MIGSLQSPAVAEVHLVLMEQWGEQMLLVDWLAETLEEGLWKVGCHSGPGTWLERHVGTALMTDLRESEKRSHERNNRTMLQNFQHRQNPSKLKPRFIFSHSSVFVFCPLKQAK